MNYEDFERAIKACIAKSENPPNVQVQDSILDMFDYIGDMFSGPLDASMQGVVFPLGHATLIEKLIDRIKKDTASIQGMESVVNSLNEMLLNLRSDDIGASKGFKCIYDHLKQFDKIREIFDKTIEKSHVLERR
jgi:hypothetical protein